MDRAMEFLKECGVFYLATVEEDQPRVRPFGAIFEYEGKLYTASNNTKKVFDQLMKNPKAEFSGMNKKGQWIRISCELYNDDRREVKEFALNEEKTLQSLYNIDDGIFAVLYFKNATATIYSFKDAPETFTF